MLLLNRKLFFRSWKDFRFIYLWNSVALEVWLVLHYITKNKFMEWLVIFFVESIQNFVVFIFNVLLLNGKYFLRSQKDLRFIYSWFSSIRIIVDYIFESPKINLWSDWWCLLCVSSQSFGTFTFNMLLVNVKSFLEVKITFESFTYELQYN